MMIRFLGLMLLVSIPTVQTVSGQELPQVFEGRISLISGLLQQSKRNMLKQRNGSRPQFASANVATRSSRDVFRSMLERSFDLPTFGFNKHVVRGQSPDEGGGEVDPADGSGASASAATDPSAILTQFQIQNVFTPSTYDSSGYSNNLILQPVLPFPVAMPGLKEFFPNHIMRPTLPIISPSADPDGPAGVEGGLGDLTLLDAYVHNLEGFGTLLLGYTAIIPTSTNSQLGLGEFQLGPAAALLYKEIPKTLLGFIYQQTFSWEGNAQQVLFSPIIVRHLEDSWYIRWGDLNWVFNTENGDYNIPINIAVGKVLDIGCQKVNIFVEPFYTPDGLRRGPAAEWGVKLNVTLLFPEKKFGPLFGCLCDD